MHTDTESLKCILNIKLKSFSLTSETDIQLCSLLRRTCKFTYLITLKTSTLDADTLHLIVHCVLYCKKKLRDLWLKGSWKPEQARPNWSAAVFLIKTLHVSHGSSKRCRSSVLGTTINVSSTIVPPLPQWVWNKLCSYYSAVK